MLRAPFQHQRKRAPGQTAFTGSLRPQSKGHCWRVIKASHAISGDQNGTGLAAESPPARRLSRCFCWGSGLFSSPVFFRSPHFMGASCARPCIYLYHQAATPVTAARPAICALRSSHSSGCSWTRLAGLIPVMREHDLEKKPAPRVPHLTRAGEAAGFATGRGTAPADGRPFSPLRADRA